MNIEAKSSAGISKTLALKYQGNISLIESISRHTAGAMGLNYDAGRLECVQFLTTFFVYIERVVNDRLIIIESLTFGLKSTKRVAFLDWTIYLE